MNSSRGKGALFSYVVIVLMFGGVFLAGTYIGASNRPEIEKVFGLNNKEEGMPDTVDFAPFWKTWNIINDKYVSGNGDSNQDRVWGAIAGLAESLHDPYTVFFPPEDFTHFRESITGKFQGVGMEVGMREGIITVIAPLKNTPAYRAGVKSGDSILAIDGASTANMSLEKAVSLIRGEKGSEVELTILRKDADAPLVISIIRDVISIPTLETDVRPATGDELASGGADGGGPGQIKDGVFIIKLFNFNVGVEDQFQSALRKFVESGSDKLVLDLRDNPGGFLEAAIDIASWFLPAGELVVKEELAGGAKGREYLSRKYDVLGKDVGVVVLINGGSASASEIVAGALQEHGRAVLVGEKSFGKGSVQELIEITPETALKLTIARWLTPLGNSISAGGLTPDVVVEFSEEDIENQRDAQMEKAIEILNGA